MHQQRVVIMTCHQVGEELLLFLISLIPGSSMTHANDQDGGDRCHVRDCLCSVTPGERIERNNQIIRQNRRYGIFFQESEFLLSAVKERSYLVCLDKSGKSLDTLQLKSRFEGWLTATNNLTFLIGGPDGLSQKCLDKSNENWSLSPLTFPHAIVPVMIIEQIYRVWSMTQNHPYHR